MEKIKIYYAIKFLSTVDRNFIAFDYYGKSDLSKEYNNLIFTINYPLTKSVTIKISKAKTLSDIVLPIAHIYKIIYENAKYYGIWGHGFSDLSFESLILNDNGNNKLCIGS